MCNYASSHSEVFLKIDVPNKWENPWKIPGKGFAFKPVDYNLQLNLKTELVHFANISFISLQF